MATGDYIFKDTWDKVRPILWAYAIKSVSYHDAEDLLSNFSFYVWQKIEAGFFKGYSADHITAYLTVSFKHRVIDWTRSRNRQSHHIQTLVQELDTTAQFPCDDISADFVIINEIADIALSVQVEESLVDGLALGLTMVDVAKELGCSKATVSRKVKRLRGELMKHNVGSQRLNIGSIKTSLHKQAQRRKGDTSMMTVKEIRAGKFVVSEGTQELAQVGVNAGKVKSVILGTPDVNKDAIVAAVEKHLGAGQPVKTEKPVKTVKPVKTEKPVKVAVKVGPNIAKWIKACGGPSKCLCGCGADVKGRFLPGHDAKLKSILKGKGKVKAYALAVEFGWQDLIVWTA